LLALALLPRPPEPVLETAALEQVWNAAEILERAYVASGDVEVAALVDGAVAARGAAGGAPAAPGPARGRAIALAGELARDQVPLVQHAQREGAELAQVDERAAAQRGVLGGAAHLLEDAEPLLIADSRREGVALEVAGQADARREHDVGVRAGAVEPGEAEAAGRREIGHQRAPSSVRIMSRI
jgi:hypothetical protein